MSRIKRKFTPAFKAKVAIEAIKEQQTLRELSNKYNVHGNQISKWKSDLLASASTTFERGRAGRTSQELAEKEQENLHKIIGEQKVEIDFLKKNLKKLGV